MKTMRGCENDRPLSLLMSASDKPREPILGGSGTVVETACPLDCPDACGLAVTVRHGRVVTIDGSHKNPVTDGFICAKVRKFGERVYGPDRLLYPALRKGRKGLGTFARVSWDEALDQIAGRMRRAKSESGGASILPFSYGGSNGLLTKDNLDATLWRRFGTSRLARTLCAAPTGAANRRDGKMPSVTYQTIRRLRDCAVGRTRPRRESSCRTCGPRSSAAPRSSVNLERRARALGRRAPGGQTGNDVAVALATTNISAAARCRRLLRAKHAHGADKLRQRAEEWTIGAAAP